jgi:hypothetical protein
MPHPKWKGIERGTLPVRVTSKVQWKV